MSESVVVGLLTFLLGLLLGHRLTLWRERRKEFNEVTTRIRVALKSRRTDPRPYFSAAERIEPTDMEFFQHLLGRAGTDFRREWFAYEAECARITQDSVGQAFYTSPEAVTASLDKLISFASLR